MMAIPQVNIMTYLAYIYINDTFLKNNKTKEWEIRHQ